MALKLSFTCSRSLRLLRGALGNHKDLFALPSAPSLREARRCFHKSTSLQVLISQKLYDVGEGTKEAEIIQWYVQEGARIEEWDKLCEVATDKSTVDISSRHGGIIKKLHHEKDTVVQVGQPLIDIEVEGEESIDPEKEEVLSGDGDVETAGASEHTEPVEDPSSQKAVEVTLETDETADRAVDTSDAGSTGKHGSLATPAVRGLLKEHDLAIGDITGTGKDGRVLKEDVHAFLAERDAPPAQRGTTALQPRIDSKQVETPHRLTPVQTQMFKTMTASLSIPHFLYSDTINITRLATLRRRLNEARDSSAPKLSYLPFVIKAVSLAIHQYPILNARVDASSQKPQLVTRSNHNIGVAMDTPNGLLVPVINNVNARSVSSIAAELLRLSELGHAGKLSNSELSGGTITVSNIGSIGGSVVAPIIVEGQLAIMGIGKVKATPIFRDDGKTVEKAEMMGASWSADHRVIDGATMARAATVVQKHLEEPATMMIDMT